MVLGTRRLLWLVVLLQVAVLLVFVAAKEYTLRDGEEIVLATVPVDPRDLFRGDYMVLRYEVSELSAVAGRFAPGDTVYVRLVESGGVWRQGGATKDPPPAEATFLRGRVVRELQPGAVVPKVEVEYGIESYFVPEGVGRKIEQQRGRMRVKVAVDRSGSAIVKELLLDGP